MKRVKFLLGQTKSHDDNNPELPYIEGNYFNFIDNNTQFMSCLEQTVENNPDNIRYLLSLAKAYNIVNRLDDMVEILTQIGQIQKKKSSRYSNVR